MLDLLTYCIFSSFYPVFCIAPLPPRAEYWVVSSDLPSTSLFSLLICNLHKLIHSVFMRALLFLGCSYPGKIALCSLFKIWDGFHRIPSLGRSWALTLFSPHSPRPPMVQLSFKAFSVELNQQMPSNRSDFFFQY